MKRQIAALCSAVVLFGAGSALFGADRLVPGVYPTIQAGINAANPGDRVIIAPGTYTGAGNRDIDFGGKAITVTGTNPDDPAAVAATIIDCADMGRAFHFQNSETASSVLAGLTITDGNATSGGAILCEASSPTITHCVFSSNYARYGGAIDNESSSPTITNSIFRDNTGEWYGGAIENYQSSPTIRNCIFSENIAVDWGCGGAIDNSGSLPTVTGCTFYGNSADYGGAIYNSNSSTTVSNSILWADSAPDGPEIYGDCTVSYSDVEGGFAGTGNIDADPCFADAGGDDFHLLDGSPCIEAGDPAYSPAPEETDIDGERRLMGFAVDMGADEFTIDVPILEVWPGQFEFLAGVGGPNPVPQMLSISNVGSDVLNWEITEDCNWLEVMPTSGQSSGEVNEVAISVDVTGLPAGPYYCQVTVSDPCATNSPQTVDVSLTVQGPLIGLSSHELDFYAEQGGPNPTPQILSISNAGAGILNWQITEDCDWLWVTPTSGQSSGEDNQVAVIVEIDGLSAGQYDCQLVISDPNAENSPQTVSVTLEILGPAIEVSSSQFVFAAEPNGPDPTDQILTIRNSGPGTLNWQIAEDCNWLSAEPNSGSSTGETNSVTLSVDIAGLTEGVYNCGLTVSDPCAMNSPQTVDVYLAIISSLVSWWQFNEGEGTTAYDSASTNHGMLMGDPNWVSGYIDSYALEFDGDDDYVRVSDDASLRFGQNDSFTISYWAMPVQDEPRMQTVAAKMRSGTQDDQFSYQTAWSGSTSAFEFAIGRSYVGTTSVDSTPAPAGSWYHVAAVYDNKDMKIYLDGELSDTGTFAYNTGATVPDGSFTIGARSYSSTVEQYFGGKIDDVRIYNRALSAGEIQQVYGDGIHSPVIGLSAVEFGFTALEGGPNPGEQTLSISNSGVGTLNWRITEDCNWLSVEPNSGSSTGETDDVTLSVDISGLTYGTYNCQLMVADPCAMNNPQTIAVTLIIGIDGILGVPSQYPTIQAAIDAALNGNTVLLAQGVYTGSGNKNLDFGGKVITVRSTDPEDPCVVAATVIDCESNGRGVYFHSGEWPSSVLAGLTITNGSVYNVHGGGIYCSGSSPTIENCIITNNVSRGSGGGSSDGKPAYGGGIYCTSGSSPAIIGCKIIYNQAKGGGGGTIDWPPPNPSNESWPCDGGDAYGGGIFCTLNSNPAIVNCKISNNYAVGGSGGYGTMLTADGGHALGGGMYFGSDCYPEINNCELRDNRAFGRTGSHGNTAYEGNPGDGQGGGIFCYGGTLNNCLITGNETGCGCWHLNPGSSANGYGGGVYCQWASINNCTISDNSAYKDCDGLVYGVGGGIYCTDAATTVSNCVVWGNTAPDSPQIYGSPAVSYSDIEGWYVGIGNIDADPCFVSGPLGDYYLSQVAAGQVVDSPCVDAGSDTAINLGMDVLTTRTDQVGDEGIVDMGYHYGVAEEPEVPGDIDGDGDVDGDDYALFAAGWYCREPNMIARGTVVVDGNLSEWSDEFGWLALDKVYYQNPNDIDEAMFALKWSPDANKVYVAVVVRDSNHVFSDEYISWDASDRIEIYSQGDAEGGSGWIGTYDVAQQYYVAPNSTGGSWATWALGELVDANAGLEYAVMVDGDWIIYEAGVRMFDNYGGFGGDTIVTKLTAGHTVGFDVVACTRRSADGFGMLSENLMTGKSNNADQFAKYVLIAESEGPLCDEPLCDLDGNGVCNLADLKLLADYWLWGK